MHHEGVQDLLAEWSGLIARHTDDATAAPRILEAGRRLLEAWSEPHRTYHSQTHLRDILARVDQLAASADDPDAVRLAAWYHDAVYAGCADDEERSAQWAERDLSALGVAPAMVDEVARLVRLTVHHDPAPGDRNGEVLSDADLGPLAVPDERYRQNSADIRAEYRHVPDPAFRKSRAQVLVTLLDSPRVFRTERGRRNWEAAARQNMRAELDSLTRPDLSAVRHLRGGRRPDTMWPMANDPVTVLDDREAWNLLSSVALGRLVTYFGGQLEIFPVNFVVQNGSVLFRTSEGTKLFTTVMNERVLFEADDHTSAEGWSVIVRGTAHMLSSAEDIREAEAAGLMPWVPTEKLRFVRVTPTEVSARRFQFGSAPDHGHVPH